MWCKDQDTVKTIPATEEICKVATEESCRRLCLFVSGDGRRILLATSIGVVFVWENTCMKNVPASVKSPLTSGRWSQILPGGSIMLPDAEDKETTVNAVFVRSKMLGDCCLCSYAFYSGERLMLAFLLIHWHENAYQYTSYLPYEVRWCQQECSLGSLVPPCTPVKSRGALVAAFTGDGMVLAVAINQKDPKATQVLFVNTLNFVTISGSLKGCSSKNQLIPSKFIRSYWVGDMSWTPNGLFLACMLKRGALILLTRLGELLSLVTSGCSVEFGPAEFIPLHPLITYRPPYTAFQAADANSSLGSSASEKDIMRQRFSVTMHPRSPYLIVSDGFMVTALRFSDNLSPSSFMKSLLLDSAQRLETMRQVQLPSKHHKGKRPKLRSLSSLKATLSKGQENKDSTTFSVIPRFLQAEEETLELRSADLQDCEEDSEEDGFSMFSSKPDSSFKNIDQGRLEFASMFDTIHATDEMDDKEDGFLKLNYVQKNLLAAWCVGISFGSVEEKGALLNCTVGCFSHLINLLRFSKLPLPKGDKLAKTVKNSSWVQYVFKLLQQCLTVLHWDVTHRQAFGHMVKLTSEVVKLMLIQQQDLPFSRTLLEIFCLLKMVSHYLNVIYTPEFEFTSASAGGNISVELDTLVVPLCQALADSNAKDIFSMDFLAKLPPRSADIGQKPDKRLNVLWRLLYQQTLRFQAQLQHMSKNDKQLKKINDEELTISTVLCHIQAILQSSGDTLDRTFSLKPVIGEEHFLLGSYRDSVEIWKRALQESTVNGGRRACFFQMRYLLAMLYCHIYHNNLIDAQGLCDQLVREVLRQSTLPLDQMEEHSGYPHSNLGMVRVHMDAALAVVQSMARFMAAYFTNRQLYVLPPHNVNILPPLHIKPEELPRVVPLQHCMVANVVRDQNLSSVWTVEYALDLLLIGGLVPEAVWFALQLGDWKMSVSIGLAYNMFCQNTGDVSWLNKVDLRLPSEVTPAHTFQEKLQSFLGRPSSLEILKEENTNYKQFTDPIEEEDADILFSSVQEMLKAAVMTDADILSDTFLLLIEAAKDLCKKFCGLVPEKLYLPAPPLYCPQPASISEGEKDDQVLKSEKDSRQKVSGVLQRILLLLRAARCSLPSAQWYIKQLKWARKVMQKIRSKSFLTPLNPFPESLLGYSLSNSAFFKPGPGGDHRLDDVSSKIIGCFRELCALCWMLHVRERLSDGCRRYQIARDNVEKQKDCEKTEHYDASVVEQCFNALEWASRMLPFSAFMNIEELVQDIILSLIGELPPVRKVADILVKAFPSPEAVRVPLRDKYNSLQQRLRHCMVKGQKGEDMMSVVMHDIHKVRLKTLKRVVRNIGPTEMNIWEPEEEEAPDELAYCYDRFSLGTSLSRSTLTECGKPQVYSDAETADTLSDAMLTEELIPRSGMQITEDVGNHHNTLYKKKDVTLKTKNNGKQPKENTSNQNALPVVGTWEFERDDDEYIAFLDLFLSYLLERDLINYSDPCIPFLTSFSEHLREHELNSLLFDVHTTLKRRQGRAKSRSVFRAGCSYSVLLEAGEESENLDSSSNKKAEVLSNPGLHSASILVLPISEPSRLNYFHGGNNTVMRKKGLFGLSQQTANSVKEDHQDVSPAHPTCGVTYQSFHSTQTPVVSKYTYKMIQSEDVVPSEELTTELKAKFGSASRLLEWMIRWSNKRLLCGSNKAELVREYSTMIRVKTSAAAILTSFWLLEQRYFVGSQDNNINLRVPEAKLIIAPVFYPEEGPKIQRESSVDTGYRGSTGTPIDVMEEGPYEKACESISEMSSKQQDDNKSIYEQSSVDQMNIWKTLNHEDDPEELRYTALEGQDILSASEDDFEEAFGATSISVSIRTVHNQTDESIEAIEIPHKEYTSEMLEEKKTEQDVSSQPLSPPSVGPDMNVSAYRKPHLTTISDASSSVAHSVSKMQSISVYAPVNANQHDIQEMEPVQTPRHDIQEMESVQAPQHDIQERKPTRSNQRDIQERNPVQGTQHNIQERETIVQSVNTSEAVRQMFQDEMFRLLQLQQLNFMSLMQVVGSSFLNLPHMQQHLQQSQPAQMEGNQASYFARSVTIERTIPTHAKDASPPNFSPHIQQPSTVNNSTGRSSNERNSNGPEINASSAESNKENMQNPPDLKPQEGQSCVTGMITATHNVLPTASSNVLPLLTPPIGIQNIPTLVPVPQNANTANAFPLLKLQPEHQFKPLNIHVLQSSARPPLKPREAWTTTKNVQNIPQDRTGIPVHLHLNHHEKKSMQIAEEQRKRWAEIVKRGHPKHLNSNQYTLKSRDASQHHHFKHFKAETTLDPQDSSRGPSENPAGIPLLHLKVEPRPFFPPIIKSHAAPLLVTNEPVSIKNIHAPPQQNKLALLKTTIPREIKVIPQTLPFQPPRLIPLQNLIAFEESSRKKTQHYFGEVNPAPIQLLKASIEPFEEVEAQMESKKRLKRRAEKQQKQEKIETKPEKKASVSFRPDDSIINDNSFETVAKPEDNWEELPSMQHGEGFVLPLGLFDSLLCEQNLKQESVPAPAELHYMAATRRKAAEIQDASTNTDPAYLPSTVPQLLPPDLYLNLRFLNEMKEKTIPSQASDPGPDLVGQQYINVIDIDASDLKDLPVETESPLVKSSTEPPGSLPAMSSAQLHHMAASVTNAIPPDEFESSDNLLHLPLSQRQKLDEKSDIVGDHITWNVLSGDVSHTLTTEQSVWNLSAKLVSKERMDSKLHAMEAQLSALQNMAENMEFDFANTELLVNTIENLGSAIDPDCEAVPYSARGVGVTEEDLARKEVVRESISDDPFQMTGLTDIADIIGDLVRDGGVSAGELGLTEKQARTFSRVSMIHSNSARQTKRTDSKKQEIQEWMKIKQRERLAQHRKKLDELREREHDPFLPRKNLEDVASSKKIRTIQKVKDEKDKALLSEHHNQRVSQALSLMKDMLSEAGQAPATNLKPPPDSPMRSSQAFQGQNRTSLKRLYSGSRSVSANPTEKIKNVRRTGFGQTRSLSTPPRGSAQSRGTETWVLPKTTSDSRVRSQSATSYPVKMKLDTSLPRDRMSQITRRGLLADRNRKNLHLQVNRKQKPSFDTRRPASASQASAERIGRKKFRNPMTKAAVCQTEETEQEYAERDSVSPWDVPDEINRILNSNQDAALFQEDERSLQSLTDIDNVSESTGSILSKLDWNMIEDMVASVEEKFH